MYDEYSTTSNVESEHSIIKSVSVGLTANSTVTNMFEKTDLNAEKRSQQRHIFQSNDIMCTNLQTKCQASKIFVKCCYEHILKRVELTQQCISKQTDNRHWIVIYQSTNTNAKHHLHFLPIRIEIQVQCGKGKGSVIDIFLIKTGQYIMIRQRYVVICLNFILYQMLT